MLLFCLVNPFAGWAYLATPRARLRREEAAISDTVKRTRLAVLPLRGAQVADSLSDAWRERMLSGLDGFETLELVPLSDDDGAKGSDLVLDASCVVAEIQLHLVARLIRTEDDRVLWSRAFEAERAELESVCDETVVGVLGALSQL